MIHTIRGIKKDVESRTICVVAYELKVSGESIYIDVSVTVGWDTIYERRKSYEACDWETNEANVMKYLNWLDLHLRVITIPYSIKVNAE